MRRPKRTSCIKSSTRLTRHASRQFSLDCSTPPNSRVALRRASVGVNPAATYSRVFSSRWNRSSSESSCSTSLRRNSERSRSGIVYSQCAGRISSPCQRVERSGFLEFHDTRNGAGKAAPIGGLLFQLALAEACERIKLGTSIVLRGLPLCGDPALLLELMEGGIERTIADLQNIAGDLLQSKADGVAIHRFER